MGVAGHVPVPSECALTSNGTHFFFSLEALPLTVRTASFIHREEATLLTLGKDTLNFTVLDSAHRYNTGRPVCRCTEVCAIDAFPCAQVRILFRNWQQLATPKMLPSVAKAKP